MLWLGDFVTACCHPTGVQHDAVSGESANHGDAIILLHGQMRIQENEDLRQAIRQREGNIIGRLCREMPLCRIQVENKRRVAREVLHGGGGRHAQGRPSCRDGDLSITQRTDSQVLGAPRLKRQPLLSTVMSSGQNFSGALSAWKGRVRGDERNGSLTSIHLDINLSELQKTMDQQGLELVENQKENVVGRKALADKTKGEKKHAL